VTYEWDPGKAQANVKKHRVTFEEAVSVFLDLSALTFWDPDHSEGEDREITIGRSARHRVLLIAHAPRDGRVGIISARKATGKEQKQYEEATP